jgi:hypothetical protein
MFDAKLSPDSRHLTKPRCPHSRVASPWAGTLTGWFVPTVQCGSTGSVWSSVLMEPLDSRARTASRAATADLHQSALANLNAHGGEDGVLFLGVVRDVDELIGHKLQIAFASNLSLSTMRSTSLRTHVSHSACGTPTKSRALVSVMPQATSRQTSSVQSPSLLSPRRSRRSAALSRPFGTGLSRYGSGAAEPRCRSAKPPARDGRAHTLPLLRADFSRRVGLPLCFDIGITHVDEVELGTALPAEARHHVVRHEAAMPACPLHSRNEWLADADGPVAYRPQLDHDTLDSRTRVGRPEH